MYNLFLIIGMISVMLSGINIGAWTSGAQQRADFHTQTTEQRNRRTKMGLIFGGIGLASFGIAALINFINNST